MNLHSVYFSCNIYRNTDPRMLKWTSYVGGSFVAADTLDGIKKLIRENK